MTNDKDAGVLFNENLFIYFKYHPDKDTVEVWRNGELISSGEGGGVTPEQLYEILMGYVSKQELAQALLYYVTDDDLEDYVTDEQLITTLADYVRNDHTASDEGLGLVKLNTAKNIYLNDDGQLEVGGRLGQFPDGGLYYPDTIEPTEVKASAFMMTDGAKNLSSEGRTFAIMGGANLTCKNTPAGSTQYQLTNSQTNRFACFAAQGGRLALNLDDARENGTALILDISFANGDPISAYYGATESDNNIIITVDRTVNPDASTKALRIYGKTLSNDIIKVGQGCGVDHGKALALGQSCFIGGNQCLALGNAVIVLANNSVGFGHTHLINQQFCFAVGQGHDFTNAGNGTSAVGICTEIGQDTAFAVGNGVFNANGNITSSNAFEVLKDGSFVIKSPNNTKYKISVADDGTLTTTAYIEQTEELEG